MSNIRNMIDVNTIIGEPIESKNGTIIIPISKVGFGFAAGGSEFTSEALDGYYKKDKEEEIQYKLPFGGGSGAGVSISPIAFLIIQEENVKLLHVNNNSTIDRLMDYIPDLIEKTNCFINKQMDKNAEKNGEKEEKEIEENEIINKRHEVNIPRVHPRINRDNEEILKEDFGEPEE